MRSWIHIARADTGIDRGAGGVADRARAPVRSRAPDSPAGSHGPDRISRAAKRSRHSRPTAARRIVIVPTLLYENGAWRARVEFRDATTATNAAVQETVPVVSSLMKDTVYGSMPSLAAAIDAHFIAVGPRRADLARALLRTAGRSAPPPQRRLRTLDSAAAFEQGLDAYEQLEYAAALKAFSDALQQDARNPLLLAWRSRTAQLMRRDNDAAEAGDQAVRLLTDQTPLRDRLFVEAVAAESRRDFDSSEVRYRDLVATAPDEPRLVLELAAFLDRRTTRNEEAIVSYQRALEMDATACAPRTRAVPHVQPAERGCEGKTAADNWRCRNTGRSEPERGKRRRCSASPMPCALAGPINSAKRWKTPARHSTSFERLASGYNVLARTTTSRWPPTPRATFRRRPPCLSRRSPRPGTPGTSSSSR